MKVLLCSFLICFVLFNAIIAHDGKHGNKLDTVTVVGKDTIAINGFPVNKVDSQVQSDNRSKIQPEEIKLLEKLFEHPHNKIIHIPIVLIVIAFFFSLLSLKDDKFANSVKLIVLLAVISSAVAFFTGTSQIQPFEGTVKETMVNTHRLIGILTLVSTVIWLSFLSIKSLKKFALLIGIISCLLVLTASFYGGIIAH